MLLSFRVANHRALRDEQKLDLRAAYSADEPVLPVAALYGANASGKSTVLDALRFMHDGVTEQNDDWRAGKGIPRRPFLLDAHSRNEPSSYAVELLLDGVRHIYGFTVSDEEVVEEWCYSYPKRQRRILFERTIKGVRFGGETQGAKSDLLVELTPPNILFLATAARSSQAAFLPVYRWFKDKLWFFGPDADFAHGIVRALVSDDECLRDVLELLRAADLGISSVEVQSPEVRVSKRGRTKGKSDQTILFKNQAGKTIEFRFDGSPDDLETFLGGPTRRGRLLFTHAGAVDNAFSVEDESRGTRTWLDLVALSLEALRNGWTLIVDEADTSLHPHLVAIFLRLFQDKSVNVHSAQLVLTTHDSSLLGRHGGEELLRRDEVWFTEKDRTTGAASLFPLTDFKPRDGLNWEKRYLSGSVGAIPFVDERRLVAAARHYAEGADD